MAKRINKEMEDLKKYPGFVSSSEKEGQFEIFLYMHGPEGSPFEGGKYKLKINFTRTSFPFNAPNVSMMSKIFHPNFSTSGSICVDFLKSEWTPAYTILKMISALELLLITPNPDSPLNSNAAEILRKDEKMYRQKNLECIAENEANNS